jgi:hypothetical protein
MAVRLLLVLITFVVLYGCGAASSPAEKQEKKEKQDQAQPADPKPKPTLETATLYVAGSNGGTYEVYWKVFSLNDRGRDAELHRFRGTGVIKDEPTAYPINLEGFTSDRNDVFFLGQKDIDMEVTKTEPWKSKLVIVLKVNDTLVECKTMDRTYPQNAYSWEGSIAFDADSRKDYKEQAGCANRLEA